MHIALLGALVLTGCAQSAPRVERVVIREPVRVEVPIPVGCEIEPGLLAPFEAELPEFIGTCAPASSGLTPENETRLQKLIAERERRLRGWRMWAEGCVGRTGSPP